MNTNCSIIVKDWKLLAQKYVYENILPNITECQTRDKV